MLLSFNVQKQIITRTDTESVVCNSMNFLYAQFTFSEEWTGTKTAVFKGKEKTYNALLDENDTCLVPWEVLTESWFYVSVFCGDLVTANKVTIYTIPSGYEIGDESRIPTPEIYNQIIEKLDGINAESIPYDNTQSGMGAENVQEALDELAAGGGGGGSVSDFDKFCDNIDIDYAFDSATNANYTVIRIYRDKLDGTKQYPFVYAPNGAEPCQKSTYEISHEDGWLFAINSGVFDTTTHTAIGMLIQNGVVLQNTPDETYNNRPLTIDENGNLAEVAYNADAITLANNGVISAVCGFMAIVKNYEAVPSSEWNNVEHYTQNAQRQIIGQFGNGDYAIITCEGRNFDHSDGWTIAEAQQICLKHGLKFAYNLDGGGSTETMFGLKHINQIYEGTTGRKVPTFILFNGKSTFTPPSPIVKELTFISATKTQTQYDVGDTLSTSDIVVTAYYTDGTHANVTNSANINTSSVDMSTAGTYSISVSYTESGITKTTSISIVVSAPSVKTLTSISATKTQTSYSVGDTLSTSDIVVTAHYSDSTSADVTSSATIDTSDVDMSAQGTYLIVVSYTESGITETTSISISVGAAVVDASFLINYSLTKGNNQIFLSYNQSRLTAVTQTENEMPLVQQGTGTLKGYMIPIPPSVTRVTVSVTSGYIPALRLITQDLTTDIDVGWSSTNVATYTFAAGSVEYLGVNVKNSTNTTIPSDVDTSSWTIVFE